MEVNVRGSSIKHVSAGVDSRTRGHAQPRRLRSRAAYCSRALQRRTRYRADVSYLTAAIPEEDVSWAAVCLMKTGGMEMGEENIRAAAPRRLFRLVEFLQRVARVGVTRKATCIFSKEGVDVASGGAAAGSHPAERVFSGNLRSDLDSRQPKGFGTRPRHDPVAMKLVKLAGKDLHGYLLGPPGVPAAPVISYRRDSDASDTRASHS